MAGMPLRGRLLAVTFLVGLVAACGGSPESPVASESALPTPTVTLAPPTEALAPSVAPPSEAPPPADAGGPYAEALVAALADEGLASHVEQNATVTTSVAPDVEITAKLTGDVSGPDLALTIELSAPGVTQVSELVVVGDTAYTRQDGDAWISAPRAAIEASLEGLLNNLRVVTDPNHLRYVGPEEFEGRELHHLVGAADVPYTPSTGGTGQFTSLDVWMEEDGTPVSIRGDFSAIDGGGNRGQGTSEMRFSKFGEPVEIEAPEVDG